MEINYSRNKKTLTVREFSAEYGISINKAYEMSHVKGFPMIQCGKRIIIFRSKLDEWMLNQAGKCF